MATSVYRGVHWDREKDRWRAEIEVGGQRFKLGRFTDERNAARAYDVACEYFGVPERRNFGAHAVYSQEKRVRECRRCRGLGLVGGEHQLASGTGGHMKFIVRLGEWRDCPKCEGAGYFIQDVLGFAPAEEDCHATAAA